MQNPPHTGLRSRLPGAGIVFLAAILASLVLAGCGGTSYRFAEADPVTREDDTRPIPSPEEADYRKLLETGTALVRRPAKEGLSLSGSIPALDVNSMDDVPASTWFEPRLGYGDLTPEQLLSGPQEIGPPEHPITVTRAKFGGGNPGFIIRDGREHLYLVKFDPPEFPAIETTTALIVNRMFWGFGYNVPEDYLFQFTEEELGVEAEGELTREDVAAVLSRVAPPVDGRYRSTVSLLLKGGILGPVPATGVRKDDPNDRIPHEKRRALRAMKMFAAFTNHSDMRIDNSLDVYEGEPGEGYVRHYLLDFGEAFGGHGAEHDYLWDGFHHMFSFSDAFKNLFTLGLRVEDWENIEYTRWRSVGAFEAAAFKPGSWKEVTPYAPMRNSQPGDDYWAGKILAALTPEHIETLVRAADYPEEGAADYVLVTLLERRRKVLEFAMNGVSPLEPVGLSNAELRVRDVGLEILGVDSKGTSYEIEYFDDSGNAVGGRQVIQSSGAEFAVAVPAQLLAKAAGYLRVDIRVSRKGKRSPAAAQFHVRQGLDASPLLVGVVH